MIEPWWYRDRNGRARLLSTNAFCAAPVDGSGEGPMPPPKSPPKPATKPTTQAAEATPAPPADDWLTPPPEPNPQPDTPEPVDAELVSEPTAEHQPEPEPTHRDARAVSEGVGADSGAEPPPPPPPEVEPPRSAQDTEASRAELQAALAEGYVGFFYAKGLRYVGTPPAFRRPKTHKEAPITKEECERYERALAAVIDRYGGETKHPELAMLAFATMMGLAGAHMGATPMKPPPNTGDGSVESEPAEPAEAA